MADHEVEVEEASQCLDELINAVLHGGDVVITRDGQPVVRLVQFEKARKAGSAKGLVVVRDDFDDPLEEFRDYM